MNWTTQRKWLSRAAMALGSLAVCGATPAGAMIVGPYTADANTVALYHFDETAGAVDPGNPFVNSGSGGSGLNLTNTGGPDGRNNSGGGGYGAVAYTGYGAALNALLAGDGTYHNSATAVGTGGGVLTGSGVTQATLQSAAGAFTYEALVRTGVNITDTSLTGERTILSHDGATTRGFSLRVIAGNLDFYSGGANPTVTAAIPTAGDHAFAANEWFHVAITYTGDADAADNLRFYWTRLDDAMIAANQIGTATFNADLGANTNNLGVGTISRNPFRMEWPGLIDEVRISTVVRGAGDFMFTVPEPASIGLIALGGLLLLPRRQRDAM